MGLLRVNMNRNDMEYLAYGHKKKEQRLAPTFVNLKSNTMKNTVQRYALLVTLQIIQEKKHVL